MAISAALNVSDDDDVNMSYNNFISKFMGLYNQCFPIVTKKIKSVRVNSKPWVYKWPG